tara:strand:+ start:1352 stop:2302 length:951 start_codon:yes stop_codon:yes gene_type:complete
MPRAPLLGYLQSAVADNTAHSQMDKLLFEDEMSNIQPEWGTMSEEQEGYDPAKSIAEGDFLPPVGMAKAIYKTSKPIWKYATGESLLEAMESSIKQSLPEIYTKKPRKWLKKTGPYSGNPQSIYKKSKKNTVSIEGRKELEKIAKEFRNIKLDLPKAPKKSDMDIIGEARNVLDVNIAEGLSEMKKFGNMSQHKEDMISHLSKNLNKKSKEYYSNPRNKNILRDIKNHVTEYFRPFHGKSYHEAGGNMRWPDIKRQVDMMPPKDQYQILGGYYEPYKIANTLLGKTGNWGAARGNLKLKPDVLNPNIVPVNKRRPK